MKLALISERRCALAVRVGNEGEKSGFEFGMKKVSGRRWENVYSNVNSLREISANSFLKVIVCDIMKKIYSKEKMIFKWNLLSKGNEKANWQWKIF